MPGTSPGMTWRVWLNHFVKCSRRGRSEPRRNEVVVHGQLSKQSAARLDQAAGIGFVVAMTNLTLLTLAPYGRRKATTAAIRSRTTDLVRTTVAAMRAGRGKNRLPLPVQDSWIRDRQNQRSAQAQRSYAAHDSGPPSICHCRLLRYVG